MSIRYTRHRRLAPLATATALLALSMSASATETTRDPYAACVAAETASRPGSVAAEARARQKCRKLYPSSESPPQLGRVEASPGVTLASPAATPSTQSTPPAASSAGAPVAPAPTPAPTPAPMPPTASHPHGGPPGLSK